MTDYLARATKWLGYSIALIVILAATLVSVGRLLTPYLNQHKSDFEDWASQLLNAPVNIGEVHISWNGYTPLLTLNKVTILDRNSKKPTFEIRKIKISVKMLESLYKQEAVLSYIKISGMDLTVRSQKSGELNVEGFGDVAITDDLLGGMHGANEVVAWVFTQPALALSDIHITFFTRAGIKKSITLNELSLSNSNTKHFLSGKGTLNQTIPTGVEIALDWRGEGFDLSAATVKLYLYLEGISLPQWFKQQTWQNLQIKEGLGSAKIWLDLNKGQLEQIQTQLQLYHLSVYSLVTHETQSISRLNGHFGWKREGDNQVIAGNDILIDLPQHLWPTTSFSLTLPLPQQELMTEAEVPAAIPKNKLAILPPSKFDTLGLENNAVAMNTKNNLNDKHFSLGVAYLDLADIYNFALSSGLLPQELENKIMAFKPRGQLTGFKVDFQDSHHLENNKISGQFTGLSWDGGEKYPGIKNLSGQFNWDKKGGTLVLNSKNTHIAYAELFNEPITAERLAASVQFQKDKNDTWSLAGKNIEIVNEDLQIDAELKAEAKKDQSPQVDLLSHITIKKANHFTRYFPFKIADPELSRWLLQAFRGGKFVSGKLVAQGRLSDFPFDGKNGIFSLTADGEDLDFGYALGWPTMKHVYGTIQFIGHKMLVDIKSGVLMDIPVKNIHGEIPYIGPQQPPMLTLNGVIDGNLAQGMALIQKSPLKNKMTTELKTLQIAGPMQLKLNINIPLKQPEHATFIGDMTIAQGTLSMPAWNMSMGDLTGALHFTEKDIETNAITGTLWREPFVLQIHTQQNQGSTPTLKLQMKGQISPTVVHSLIANTSYANVIKGGTNYQAELQWAAGQLSKPIEIIVSSDLKGITLDLPAGLGKMSGEVIPSKLVTTIQQNKPLTLEWVYGNKLTAAATFKNTKNAIEFYSAEVHLGNKGKASLQTQPGIVVSGQFDTLDWITWKNYFSGGLATQKNQSSQQVSELFRSLDIHANKIIGFFQPLNKVHIQLSKLPDNYSIKIDSAEITGEVTIPLKSSKDIIKANFEHFYLAPVTLKGESFDPKLMPALRFESNDVRYQDKRFGRLSFNISPIQDGFAIEFLRLNADLFSLDASGEWTLVNNKNETQVEGKLTTKNVAEFLSYWGSPTVNPAGSSGDVIFDLTWPDAMYSPNLAGMSGKVDLKLSHGHIVNLDESTTAKMGFGRILNLLSLDSISRALTLNFSDLTEKGYSFDYMKGRFTLKDGNAYTDDMRMQGSVASIEMSGRLGLAAKDYDVKLSVTPFVTGSIPVVAALAVNPIVGVAAWALEKVAGKAVSSATTHHYEVTGTWDKPVWVEK